MATEANIPEDASDKQNTGLEDRDLKIEQLDSISNECSREGSVKLSCGLNQFPQGFECSSEAEKADIVGDQTKNIMTTSTRTPKDISSAELSSPDEAPTEDISKSGHCQADIIVNQELTHNCENEKHHSKDIETGADKNEVINGINVEEEHVHEKANDAAQVSRLACAEEPILKVHEEESLDQNLQVVKNQNASTQVISEIMETEMISSQKNENTISKGEKDSNLECNEQARSIFEANLGPINEDLLPNLDWAAKSLGNEDERVIESCIKDEDIDSNNTKYAEDEYKEITLKAGQNKKKEMPSALEDERKAPQSVVSSDKSEHCYEEHKLMHDRTEDSSTVNVAESPYNHSFEGATLKTTSKNGASTEGVALEAGESMNEASSKACQEKNKDNESIWQEKDVPPVDGKDIAEKSAWLNRDGGGAKEDEFSQIGLSETIENSKTTPENAEKSTEQNEQQDKLGGHVALIPENTEIVAPRENAEKSTEQVRHPIEKYEEEEEEKDEPTSIIDSGETLFPTEKSHLLVESITKNESAELKIPQKNASDVDSKYLLVEKTEQAESVETGEVSKTEQTCAENENQAEDQSEEESKGTELDKVPKAHTDEKVEIVDGGKSIPKEAKEGEAANDMQLNKTATESVLENEATSRLSSTEFIRDEAIEQGFQEESIKDAELTLATDNESPRQESIKDVERNTKVDEAFDEPSTGRENTSDVTSEGSSAEASGVPKNTTCMAVVDDSKKNEAEIQEVPVTTFASQATSERTTKVGEQSNAENSVSKSQKKENIASTLSSASGMETGKEYPEEDLNEETRMKEEVHVMITETKEQIEAAYSTERKISSTSDDFLEPKENHGDLTTEENKNNLVENSPSISGVFEKDDCSTNDSETDFLKVASEGNTAMKEVKPVNEEQLETSDAAPENRNIETIETKANSLDNVNIDEKQEEETISEENRNIKAADEADKGGQQMSHDIKDKALITRIDHEKEVTISTPEKTPARDDTLYVDSETSFIVHSNSMLGSSDNEHENADEGIQKHPDEDLVTLKTENNISGREETEQWKGEQFSSLADENDASKLEIVKDEKSIVDVSKNINNVSCNEKAELEDEEVAEKAEANSAVVGVERKAAELTKAGSSTTEEDPADTKNAELADKNAAFKLEIVKEEKSTVEVLKHIEDVSSYSLDNEKAELQDEELFEKYEANSSVSVERKAAELKAGSSITDEEPADTKDDELEDENEASQLEIVEDESTVEVPKHIEDVSCMDNEKAELEDEEVVEKAEANSAVVGVEREAAELTKAGSSTTEEEPADTKNAELVDKNAAFKLEIVKEEKSTVEVLKHIEDVLSRSLDNEKAELEDEELVEKYEANSSVGAEREAAELNAGSSITEEEPVDTKDDELEDENEASQLEIVEDESTVEVPKHIEDVSCMDNEKTDMEDEELVEKVEGNSAVAVVEREATEHDAVSSSTEEEPANTKNDELLREKADRTYENIPCELDHNVESPEKILDMSLQKKEESLLGEHDNSTQEGASIDDQHEHAYSASVMEDNGEKSGLVKGKDQDAKITLQCGEYLKQTLLNDGREKLEEISDIFSEGSKEDASREYTENTSKIREPTTIRLEKISHKENVEEKVNAVDDTKENEAENPEVLVTDGASQATSEKIIKACESSNSETSVLKSQEEIENPVGTLSSASVGKEKGKEYPNDDKNEDTKIMEEVQVTNSESKEEIEETYVIYREISNTLHDSSEPKDDHGALSTEENKIKLVKNSSETSSIEHSKGASTLGSSENEKENADEGIQKHKDEHEALPSELKTETNISDAEEIEQNTPLADENEASKLEIVKDEKSTVQVSKHIEDVSCMDVEKAKLKDEELVEKFEGNSAIVVVEREAAELKAGSSSTEEEPADTKNDELADGNDASKLEIVEDESTVEVPKHIEDASCVDNEKTELENEDLVEKVEGNSAFVAVQREAAELKAGSSSTEEEPADTKNDELADGNDASKLEIVKDESTVQVPKHIEDASCVDNEKTELENEDLVEKVEGNSAVVAVEREAAELKAGSSSTEEEPVDTKNDELADGNDASKLEIIEDEPTVEVPKHIEDASYVDNEKTELENENLVQKVEGNSAVVAVKREAAELKAGSSSTEEEPADTKNDELADGNDVSKLEIIEDESTVEVPKHIEDASCVDNEKTELENENLVEKVEGNSAVVAVEREAAELKAGSSSTEEEPADTKNDELADGNDASKLEIVEDESTVEVPKHVEDASCVDNEKTDLENEDLVEKVEGNSAVVAVKREAAELKAGSSSTEEEPSDTKNDELADENDASKLEIVEDESTIEVPKHTEDASCVDNEKTELENEDLVEKVEGNSAVVGVERDATKLKARSSSNEEEPSDKKTDELLMEEADRKDEDIHTKSDHNVKSTEKILGMSVQRKEESRVPEGASLEDQDEYAYSINVVDDEKSGLAEGKDQDAKITLKCEEQLKQTPQNDGKEKLEELPDMISEGSKAEASIEYPENTNTAEEPTTTRLEKISKKKNEAENQEVPVATDASQATSEKVTKAPEPLNTEASVSKPQEIENTVGTLSSASVGMETGKEYPDEEESQGTKVKVTIEESKEQIEATYLIEREISNTLHGFSEPKEDHGASSMEENKNNLVENSPVLEMFEKDDCSPNDSKIEFLRAVSEGNPAIQELKPVNQEQLQGSDAFPEMKDVTAIETKANSLGQVEETNSRKNKDMKVQEVADEGGQRSPLNEEQKEIETSMKTDKTPARDGTLYVESGTSFIVHSEGASILGSSENEKKDANEGIQKHKDEDQALLSDLKTETNISNTEEIEQWKREKFSGLADENEGSKLETVKDEKSTLEVLKHIEVFSCMKSEKAVLEEKVLAENAEENSAVAGLEREATEMKARSPNTEEEPASTEKGETLMKKTFNDLQSDRTDENIPCESNENVEGPEEILDTSLKTKDKSLLGEHDNPTPREASIEDQDEYANSVSAAKDNDEEYSKQMLQNDGKERLEELPDMIFARSVEDASREYPENTTCTTGEETTARLERTSRKENIEENAEAIDDIKENQAENQEVLVTTATIQANRERMIKKKVCESSNTEDSVSKPQEIENTVRTLPSASVMIEPSKEYPEEDESEETNMKEEVKVTITESKEQIEAAYSIERKVSNISDDFLEPKEVHGDWSTEENKNNIVENSSSISGVFDKEQLETSEPTPENRNVADIETKANSLNSVNIDEKQEEETVSNEIRDLKVAEVEDESRQRLSCDIKDEALITGINLEKEVTISTPLLDDQLVRTFKDSSVLPSYEEPKTKDKTPERDGTIYVDSETSSIGHSKGDSLLGSSDNEKENADEGIQKPRDEDLYVPPELITENNISDMDFGEKWKKEQASGLADRHDACKLETVNNEEATVEVSKHMEVVTYLNSEKAVPEEEELAEESEDSSAVLELEREEAAQKAASPSAEEESASTKNGELPIEKVHYKVETADNNENIKELLTGSRTISIGEETGNKVEVSNSGFKEQTEATELTVEKESVTLKSHTEQNMEIIDFSASTSTDASEAYSEHFSSTSKVYEKQTEAEVSKKDKAVIDDAKNDSLTVVIEETDLKKVEQVNEENNKGSDSAADNNDLTTIAAEMTILDCKDIDERQEENSSLEKKGILDEVNEGHLKMNRCVKEIDETTATQLEREVVTTSIPMSIEEKDTMTTATFNTIETADETAETYLHARENELLQKEHEVCKPGGVTELETVDIRMECSNDNIIKLDNEDLHMLSDDNTKTTSTGKDGEVTQGQENLATTFEGSLTGVSIKKAATAQDFSHEHKPADELSVDKTVEAANTDEKLELASESMAKEQSDEKIYQAKGKGNTEDQIFKSSDDIPGKKLQGEAQRKSTQFEVVHHISVPQNAHETSATDGCTEKVLKGNEEANGSENILEQILGPKRISNEPDIVSAVDKTVNEVTAKNSGSIKQIEEMNERESEILGNFSKANEDFSSLTAIEASEEGTQREDSKTLFRMSSLVSQEVEKEIKAEIFQKENDTNSTFQTLPCTLVNEETSFKETTEEHSRQVDNFVPFSEGKDVAITDTVKPSLEINDPDDIQEKSSSSEKSREYQSLEIVDEAGQNMDQDFTGQAPTTGVEHENEEGSSLTLIEHDNLQNPSVMQTEEDNYLPDKISNSMAKYLAGEDHDAEKDVHDVIRPEVFPELGIAVIEKSDNKEIQNQDDEDLNQLHNLNTQSTISYRKDVEIPRTEKGSVSTNQSEGCTLEMEKDKKPCIEVSKYTADETCIDNEKDSDNFRSSSNFIAAEKLPAESTKTEKNELPEEKILEPAHLGTKLKSSSDSEAHNQTNEQLPQIKEKSNNIQDWISVSVEHIPGQTSMTSLVTKEVHGGVDEAGGSENIEEQIINSEVNLMEPQILSARGATVNLVKDHNFISTKNLKATDSSEQKVIADLTIEDDPTRKEAAVEVLKVESSTRQAESDKRNHYLASEINENVLQMPLKPIEETIPEVQPKNEEPRRAIGINTGVEETEIREEKIGHLEEPQQAAAILDEEARIGSERDDKGGDECREIDPVLGATVTVEGSKDTDVKVTHRKSHNILSGVGSKVKHSISKVKKAITGKSSHPKSLSPK